MKLKGDFITNSSSTAYIVSIPKDFSFENIDKNSDEYKQIVDDYNFWLEDMDQSKLSETNLEKLIENFISEIKNDSSIDIGGMGCDTDYKGIYGLQLLFKDFIILRVETGADIPNQMININSKNLKSNKTKLIKLLLDSDRREVI